MTAYESRRRYLMALVGTVCAICAVLMLQCATSSSAIPPPSSYASQVAGASSAALGAMNNFLGAVPNDPRTYSGGVFTDPGSDGCWWCLSSAGTAAAVLAENSSPADPGLLQVALDTYSSAITNHQQADGSFDGNAIETSFFSMDLGMTYFELQNVLSPATRAAWRQAIQKAADYLVSNGYLTWYTNGNINLRETALMWLTWKLTGDPKYYTDFANEWAFTMSPPQSRWPGFGLQITKQPTMSDDSDGAAYLAEAASGAPGFDSQYTMTQLDDASRMWVLSHDPRWLGLMNLFFNQIRPRIDTSTFVLDATGGSRTSLTIPFYSAGLVVLYHSGDRPDLAGLVGPDLQDLDGMFTNTGNFTGANMYRGISCWLGVVIADYQHPNGVVAASPSATAGSTAAGTSAGAPTTNSPSTPTTNSPSVPATKSPTAPTTKSHSGTTTKKPSVHGSATGARSGSRTTTVASSKRRPHRSVRGRRHSRAHRRHHHHRRSHH